MRGLQSLDEFVSMLRRRFWVMALVFLIGCGASVWYALQQPRVYEAAAAVQIRGAVVEELSGATAADDSRVAQQLELIERRIMARDNIVSLVERYGLFQEPPDLDTMQKVGRMRGAIRLEELRGNRPEWMPGGNQPSGLIIWVQLEDPETAAIVANDLMGSVISQSREGLVERARTTRAFFEEEERRLAEEIAALEDRIADFKRRNAEAMPDNVPALRDQLSALRETELEIERQIIAQQATSERQRMEVLERQQERLENQQKLVASRIDEIEASLASAPDVERQFSALSRELLQLQERFTAVTRSRADAELQQMLEDQQKTETFEVLETAIPPTTPVSTSRRNIALAGGAASLVAAGLVALLLEMMNPAIRSPAQLERRLGIRPVVSIPTVRTSWDIRRRRLTFAGAVVVLVLGTPPLVQIAAQYVPTLQPIAEKLPGFLLI